MAEYKPLVRNTIKITTETTLYHNTDLDIGEVLVMPRIKHISEDKSMIEYAALTPSATKSSTNDTEMRYYCLFSGINNSEALPYYAQYECFNLIKSISASRVSVDGATYYGYKSARYIAAPLIKTSYSSGSSTTVKLSANGLLPACKAKIVVFVSSTETISTLEIDAPSISLEEKSYTGRYPYVIGTPELIINKGENDIVLALEIEYPKHDITLNTTVGGLQYSLDDGLTFTDVTDGTTLEQIEHVVFKNTSDALINVGTKNGGLDVGSIAAGATYVAVPEADGTWFIS